MKYFFNGKRKWSSLFALLAVVSVILCIRNFTFWGISPFKTSYIFDSPSFVSVSDDGTLFVTDQSKSNISVLNPSCEITAIIKGEKRDGKGFFVSDYTASDGQYLYTTDLRYAGNGARIAQERILRYTLDGMLDKTIYEQVFDEGNMPLQYGNIVFMRGYQGHTFFLQRQKNGVSLYRITGDEVSCLRTVPMDKDEAGYRYIYDPAGDRILYTSRRNAILEETKDHRFAKLFDYSEEDFVILGELGVDGNGIIYEVDMDHGTVISPQGQNTPAKVGQCYRISVNSAGTIGITDNVNIKLLKDNQVLYDSDGAVYGKQIRMRILMFYVSCAYLLIGCIGILRWLARRGYHTAKVSASMRYTIALAVVIIITGAAVSFLIYSKTSQGTIEEQQRQIRQITQAVSELSSDGLGDQLDRIQGTEDYGGEAFNAIRRQLDAYCDASYSNNSNLYYILYQFNEKRDRLYGIMDYEDTINGRYPYSTFLDSGYDQAVYGQEVISINSANDSYGCWAYCIAPVYNSAQQVCGIVEFGTDLRSEQQKNQALIRTMVVSVLALMIILLLIVKELVLFSQAVVESKACSLPEDRMLSFVRQTAFLLYCTNCCDSAFVPQMAEKLIEISSFPIPKLLGAALPLSMLPLFIAAAALVSAVLIRKQGIRKVYTGGTLLSIAGLLLASVSNAVGSYPLLLVSKACAGLGTGAVMVVLNSMPGFNSDNERKNQAFTGINLGLVSGVVVGNTVGAYLAGYCGYSITYLCAAVCLMPVIGFAKWSVDRRIGIQSKAVLAEEKPYGMAGILHVRRVLTFFVFVMMPFLILMCFKDYVFPVFASENGQDEVYIGNILLFAGAATIFMGGVIADLFIRKLGDRRAMLASSVLIIAAVVLFGIYPNDITMMTAVFFVSIAGCIGLVCQEIYYTGLDEVEQYGYGSAMGVYSLIDNFSQMLGPLVFSVFLGFGYRKASLMIAGVSVGFLAGFIVIGREKSS